MPLSITEPRFFYSSLKCYNNINSLNTHYTVIFRLYNGYEQVKEAALKTEMESSHSLREESVRDQI